MPATPQRIWAAIEAAKKSQGSESVGNEQTH